MSCILSSINAPEEPSDLDPSFIAISAEGLTSLEGLPSGLGYPFEPCAEDRNLKESNAVKYILGLADSSMVTAFGAWVRLSNSVAV